MVQTRCSRWECVACGHVLPRTEIGDDAVTFDAIREGVVRRHYDRVVATMTAASLVIPTAAAGGRGGAGGEAGSGNRGLRLAEPESQPAAHSLARSNSSRLNRASSPGTIQAKACSAWATQPLSDTIAIRLNAE